MSLVTNVVLHLGILESERTLATVNQFFPEGCGFRAVPDSAVGGTKGLETELAIGAFNYLNLHALCAHLVKELESYGYRHDVQLFVMEQEDDKFKLYNWPDILLLAAAHTQK